MDKPLVSVIIPNYNYERSLELCVQSVLEQTYDPIDVTVVDDGSTDGSVAVAERLGVRVLRTPSNSGSAAARNLGAVNSSGEILFFLDSDVALEPDAIANAVGILQSDPTIGAVCGIYDPEPLIVDSKVEEYRTLQFYHWTITSEGNVSFLFSAMCAIPRRVFADIGPFNTALRQTEEVDYGYRLNRHYQLRLTSAVRGRHDHDHQLRNLLRKLFHRSRLRVPLYVQARQFAKGFETAPRVWASLAALLAVATLPVALLLGPLWPTVPVVLLAASVTFDADMYRFVLKRRGFGFLLYFLGLHFIINLVIAAGAVIGAAQWLLSPRFRGLYNRIPKPTVREVIT